MKNMLQRQFMTSEPLYLRGRATRYCILASSLQLKYDLPLLSLQEGILRFFCFNFSFFYPLCNHQVRVDV